MKHFVHYQTRQVAVVNYRQPDDPWFTENQPDDQGFDAPTYHVTRAVSGAATRVEEGDTIWLFSQLRSPWGKMPPALDARIVVSNVADLRATCRKGEPAFRFAAGKGSSWFPLFDATGCLTALKTVDLQGTIRDLLKDRSQHAGAAMRRMRELADADKLLELERTISKAGFQFISYRLADGTRPAFERCRQQVEDGAAVWWDRWSLPRRLAERREFVSDDKLNQHILNRIRASNVVWGIESDLYAAPGSYSLIERDLARTLETYRPSPL